MCIYITVTSVIINPIRTTGIPEVHRNNAIRTTHQLRDTVGLTGLIPLSGNNTIAGISNTNTVRWEELRVNYNLYMQLCRGFDVTLISDIYIYTFKQCSPLSPSPPPPPQMPHSHTYTHTAPLRFRYRFCHFNTRKHADFYTTNRSVVNDVYMYIYAHIRVSEMTLR